jgi:hypothetical protein
MATKKIFRLDLLTEWLRKRFSDRDLLCLHCPVNIECIEFAYDPLCDEDYAEEFKQAIIDKFSTEVEVVEDDGFAQAIIDRFSAEVE